MAGIQFKNSPLVELIAELRWGVADMLPSPAGEQSFGAPPQVVMTVTQHEDFFMKFGGAIYGHGFQDVERLVPPNFPYIVGQPARRFRKSSDAANPVLYQVGPGIFTANATAPYKNWDEFAPVVAEGVAALLKTRAPAEADSPFVAASVRYIDAFGVDFIGEDEIGQFIAEKFGIKIELPAALTSVIDAVKQPKPFLQLQIPISGGLVMSVGVGEGVVQGQRSVVLDTTVVTVNPTAADLESVMQQLHAARGAIHKMFISLTDKLREKMQPVIGD
jgi:uncharacterized protein (TIGR04255 family)